MKRTIAPVTGTTRKACAAIAAAALLALGGVSASALVTGHDHPHSTVADGPGTSDSTEWSSTG
ncbi:hypothetical protein [Streptomyces sp. NBC_00859]|uniref:hypothetical protein n=1 Tax=Streptomyces sp. NBC_00859 TaxID=2903682 RepID=UPI0038636849|nr:hypothetical protein OG584_00480 [Streptomyces sp. NBC_00859]